MAPPEPDGSWRWANSRSRGLREATRRACVRTFNAVSGTVQHAATCMSDSAPRCDVVAIAETRNGHLAMLGFVIVRATERLTSQGILSPIGLA